MHYIFICTLFLTITEYFDLPYQQRKAAVIMRDSVECLPDGEAQCVGLFIQIPCEL